MRLSAGGWYEINGAVLRRVSEVSPGPKAGDGWRDRQADLWAESSTLIHVDHSLTAQELGLWGAMQKELGQISRVLVGIDRDAMTPPSRH
jgi:hypothetical protein